jgi:3-methyladenine DNA glycosylase AlkD
VGRNHQLSLKLWDSDYFDAKLMACFTEEYKKVTEEQIDIQVKSVNFWLLSHTYIGDLVAKTQHAQMKADLWIAEQDNLLRRCGFLLLYWLAKDNKKLPDSYFEVYFLQIKYLQQEENFVKDAMNNALFSIGKRNLNLHRQSLKLARANGVVIVDYGDNSCQAIDVVKHLTSDYVTKKLRL